MDPDKKKIFFAHYLYLCKRNYLDVYEFSSLAIVTLTFQYCNEQEIMAYISLSPSTQFKLTLFSHIVNITYTLTAIKSLPLLVPPHYYIQCLFHHHINFNLLCTPNDHLDLFILKTTLIIMSMYYRNYRT